MCRCEMESNPTTSLLEPLLHLWVFMGREVINDDMELFCGVPFVDFIKKINEFLVSMSIITFNPRQFLCGQQMRPQETLCHDGYIHGRFSLDTLVSLLYDRYGLMPASQSSHQHIERLRSLEDEGIAQ